MSEKIRSFIAFDIDDKNVLKKFQEVQDILVSTGANLKLVIPQNIHVTIRFLGNITLGMVNQISEEMSEVSFAPFNIEIQGLGVFPSLNYARVIWAGVQGGVEELRNICNQLDSFLRGLGLKLDSKGFSPHITIARVRTGRNKAELIRRLMDIKDFDFGVIKANCLRLKKSVLTQKGPIYNTIYEVNAVES